MVHNGVIFSSFFHVFNQFFGNFLDSFGFKLVFKYINKCSFIFFSFVHEYMCSCFYLRVISTFFTITKFIIVIFFVVEINFIEPLHYYYHHWHTFYCKLNQQGGLANFNFWHNHFRQLFLSSVRLYIPETITMKNLMLKNHIILTSHFWAAIA